MCVCMCAQNNVYGQSVTGSVGVSTYTSNYKCYFKALASENYACAVFCENTGWVLLEGDQAVCPSLIHMPPGLGREAWVQIRPSSMARAWHA